MNHGEHVSCSYEHLHHEQLHYIRVYPRKARIELREYDDLVCKYYSVDRTNPEGVRFLPSFIHNPLLGINSN